MTGLPTPTPSPTPSPSVAATAAGDVSAETPEPLPTTGTVEAQVEATVRRYFSEINRAARTGDTSVLHKIVDKGCPCWEMVRSLDEYGSAGERSDIRYVVDGVQFQEHRGDLARVTVHARHNAYSIKTPSGVLTGSGPAETLRAEYVAAQGPANWLLTSAFNLDHE